MNSKIEKGSVEAFQSNWRQRPESKRYHFKRGAPENQIQFAFQSHWRVFRKLLGETQSGRALEVGCGRGSMSAFFADAGFEVHLLDTSDVALKTASSNFVADGLRGHYICGDCLALPYASDSFDVVLSIGLLEHFAEIEQPLYEQIRVLKPGGLFLGYVVPERFLSVQTLASPINFILRLGHATLRGLKADGNQDSTAKLPLYRNSYAPADYLTILRRLPVRDSASVGMFPVPLISHSPNFPFSLMAPQMEQALVKLWQLLLSPRSGQQRDPWTCSTHWGLAFLVWASKGKAANAKK
jgi:2-polyprenyl-3-methyl-5-hydroxy-6-metoxy-1,4-benzoquinol methylase